ncbi:MAG: DUF882 domain-containing protein [Alphaproteobacteria bacterium]|nr:DUF882 domain-containing protein [Alphaproteobacteria bacterium]
MDRVGGSTLVQFSKNRRRALRLVAGAAAVLIAAPAVAAPRFAADRRSLAFHNMHTGESLDLVYWSDGTYQADALQQIDRMLRDFRTGEVHPIDPRLLDLLVNVERRLDSASPFVVISGYRSPATNAMLRRENEGVAKSSLHMKGQAIDVRVPGRALSNLHRVAMSLCGGGVGYYPRSDFVHIDVGRVRYW